MKRNSQGKKNIHTKEREREGGRERESTLLSIFNTLPSFEPTVKIYLDNSTETFMRQRQRQVKTHAQTDIDTDTDRHRHRHRHRQT